MPEISPGMRQTALSVATTGQATNNVQGSFGSPQGQPVAGPYVPVPVVARQKIHVSVNWANGATGTGFTIACFRQPGAVQIGTTLTHNLAAAAATVQAQFDFLDSNVPGGSVYSFTLVALSLAGTANDIVATCNDFT